MAAKAVSGLDLWRWRQRQGCTLEQLSQRTGVPANTLHRWEAGSVGIRHGGVLALALAWLEAHPEGHMPRAHGSTLRSWREQRGLGRKVLAIQLGIQERTLASWEAGEPRHALLVGAALAELDERARRHTSMPPTEPARSS